MAVTIKSFKGRAKPLDDWDFGVIAKEIGVGEDEVHATVDVEASGEPFDNQGRPKALYEPHKAWAYSSGAVRDALAKAGLAYPKWKRNYPKDSYPRIQAAQKISEEVALMATSWGGSQILGYEYRTLGYPTVQAMVRAFMDDAENHVKGMIAFIKGHGIDDDLRRIAKLKRPTTPEDAVPVVRVYNGSGYAANGYHTKWAKRHNFWRGVKDTTLSGDAPAALLAMPPASPVVSAVTGDVVYTDIDNVKMVQLKLIKLGYTEVGGTEGAMGTFTETAILAFRRDNGLPLTPVIDDALIDTLGTAKKREVAQARTDATVADVTTKVPEAKHNWRSKIGAGALAVTGAGGTFFNGVLENLSSAGGYVNEVTGYFDTIPGWVWFLALLGVAGFIYYQSQKSENASVEAFKTGARR